MKRISLLAVGAFACAWGSWAGAAAAQPVPEIVPPFPPSFSAEAPLVAGNAVAARERALREALRMAVSAALGAILAEDAPSTAPPPPAALLNRARDFVRSYRLLEQQNDGAFVRVKATAEIDQRALREALRAMAQAGTPAAPAKRSLVFVHGDPVSEKAVALLRPALAKLNVETEARQQGGADALVVEVRAAVAADDQPLRGVQARAIPCRLLLLRKDGVRSETSGFGFADNPPAATDRCLEQVVERLTPLVAGWTQPVQVAGVVAGARTVSVGWTEVSHWVQFERRLRAHPRIRKLSVAALARGLTTVSVLSDVDPSQWFGAGTEALGFVPVVRPSGQNLHIDLVPQGTP